MRLLHCSILERNPLMRSSCIESADAAAYPYPMSFSGLGRRSPCKRGRRGKRFLRRAAIGIAGTGWAFFGTPSLGDVAAAHHRAGSAPPHQASADDILLRIVDLPGTAPGMVRLPLANSANDSAAAQFA